MLSKNQKEAIIKALERVLEVEKPYMRLCADIRTSPPISLKFYNEIKNEAHTCYEDAVFMIGKYEDELRPAVERHLKEKNFSYSIADIDGVKINGNINTAVWLIKDNLEKNKPEDFDSAFEYLTEIIVAERVKSYEEIRHEITEPEVLQRIEVLGKGYGLKEPPVLKIIHGYSAPGSSEYRKGIFSGLEFPYLSFPPCVWHLYGEIKPVQELLELEKLVRRNPKKFIPLV